MSRKVNFFAEFVDSNGHTHYAIHAYDRITGIVDMMRDYKFEKASYLCSQVRLLKKNKSRFVVEFNKYEAEYYVLDTENDGSIVGTFYDRDEANDYVEFKNSSLNACLANE